MRRRRLLFSVVVVAALVGAACGSNTTSGGTGGTTSPSGPKKAVGMALPGPKNDKGFNEGHYNGLLDAGEKYGVETAYVENVVDPQARIDAVKNLSQDNGLVIGVGGEYADAGLTVAPQFPNVEYGMINGEMKDGVPNLHAYFVRQGVPAYIAGVIAAMLTKSKHVGYLGGELIPPTTQSDDGFKQGVQDTDSSIQYAHTIVGNFNDAAKAKEAAAAQISAGVDVIFALLDAGFPGVEQAVTESGKDVLLMNPIFPRCDEGPNIVGVTFLSSVGLVDKIVDDYLKGTMPEGQPKFYGVDNQDIQRFDLCDAYKSQFQSTVDDVTQKLNSGEITLPKGV
jgi:basic membrane protein A and related proteins